ncbi:MAG: DUF3313 family protein [Gammaproteobacteria bacterium]
MKNTASSAFILFVCFFLGISVATAEVGDFPVEQRFLSVDFELLTPINTDDDGVDLVYASPEQFAKLVNFDKIMVDQPEIWLDEDSDYRGVKPDNVKAIADLIREVTIKRVSNRGYEVVEQPGENTLYMRIALTNLYLKKEKRGVLGYTPVGAVLKVGADAVRDMMSKVDIIEMALQTELSDSQTGEVLGAMVIKRGARKDKDAGQKEQRMDFDEFRDIVQEYSARFACRLDNARKAEAQKVDCLDDAVLKAGGYFIED